MLPAECPDVAAIPTSAVGASLTALPGARESGNAHLQRGMQTALSILPSTLASAPGATLTNLGG